MTTVAEISCGVVREQAELLAEYAGECGLPELGEPQPQWAMYEQMQAVGMLWGFGVYADGVMAGFAFLLVSVVPHYGVKAATVESLFVAKEHRRSHAGAKLMAAMERHAVDAGCRAILYGAPVGGEMEAVLGKRYARVSSMYCKPLGELA